jgi:hypothetical protein
MIIDSMTFFNIDSPMYLLCYVKCFQTIDLKWGEIIFFYKMNEYENMLEEFELGTLSFSVICIRYKHPKGNYFLYILWNTWNIELVKFKLGSSPFSFPWHAFQIQPI